MTAPAAANQHEQVELWASACQQSFQQSDNRKCIEYASQILAAWQNAGDSERKKIRKAARIGLRCGCLACLKINDVNQGMVFYEEALNTKKVCWDLGIRAARHLARLGRMKKLATVIRQLRAWAATDAKYQTELDSLLASLGIGGPRPKVDVQKITSTHFAEYPANASENDSGLWMRALSRTVFVPASGRFTVVINPKAACSTLKFALWNQEFGMGATDLRPPKGEYIHLRRTAIPKASIAELESALFDRPVFSIVRNPFTRILSAYLDKIASDKKEKRHLLLCMGHFENVPIAFGEFIDFICRQNSQEMDSHYAPQVSLMQLDYIPYVRIGCVEDMDNSLAAIMAAGYSGTLTAMNDFRPHRTGAASRVAQYYTADLAAKVRGRFRADFDRFGYSHDPADAHLPPRHLDRASQSGQLAESVLRPMLRATLAERNRDHTAALNILSAIESNEPDLAATRARILLKLSRPREALDVLSELVERVPNVSHYWMMLAESLLATGRTSEAIRAADTAAFIMPSDVILHRARRIMERADERQKAEAYGNRIAIVEALSIGRPLARRLAREANRANRQKATSLEDTHGARLQ